MEPLEYTAEEEINRNAKTDTDSFSFSIKKFVASFLIAWLLAGVVGFYLYFACQ